MTKEKNYPCRLLLIIALTLSALASNVTVFADSNDVLLTENQQLGKVKLLSSREEKLAEKELFRLINSYRIKNRVKPLNGSVKLNKAAKIRSNEIIDTFEHFRPDGRPVKTVANDVNLTNFWSLGENIASNMGFFYSTPNEYASKLFSQWTRSEGHRKNMLLPYVDYMGVGITTTEYTSNGALLLLVK